MLNKIKTLLISRLFLCIVFGLSMPLGIYLGIYKSSSVSLYFIAIAVITAIVLLVKEFTVMVDEMYNVKED